MKKFLLAFILCLVLIELFLLLSLRIMPEEILIVKHKNASIDNTPLNNKESIFNNESIHLGRYIIKRNNCRIRVLLSDKDYKGFTHDKVALHSDSGLFIMDKNGISHANEIEIKKKELKDGDRVLVKAEKNEEVILDSIQRDGYHPAYKGTLEIEKKNGKMYLINEVKLEDYVAGVIASEIPESFDQEAKKALAVAVRGYAAKSMQNTEYMGMDANLCDSTKSQVYNRCMVSDSAIEAVKETEGYVLTYMDELITPYFFSTSAGITCNNKEIWGGNSLGYLEVSAENSSGRMASISDEGSFYEFITTIDENAIEKDMPYYRWKIEADSGSIIEALHNGRINERDISVIGRVKDISVSARAKSGAVTEVTISGEAGNIKINAPDIIRGLINPKKLDITLNDSKKVKGHTMLPSSIYYILHNDDGFIIYGGGFGHGVGLSQNGANILAKQGYDHKMILEHYYTDVKLINIYTD